MSAAAGLMERLDGPDAASISLTWTEELPDVLHALCRRIQERADAADEKLIGAATATYALIEQHSWLEDQFEEKSEILASIAAVAWNECRRRGRHAQMKCFEERCEKHARERQDVRAFLALPFADRSPALNARFLSDLSVLIASVAGLFRRANQVPRMVAEEAVSLLMWIVNEGNHFRSPQQTSYFSSQLALTATGALRHLGRLRDADRWLAVAASAVDKLESPDAVRAQVEYARLAILYDKGEHQAVLEASSRLIECFGVLGMPYDEAKARFLAASSMKAVEGSRALSRFAALSSSPAVLQDSMLRGLCLMHTGELSAREGHYAFAMKCLAEARPFLERTGVCFGLAHLYGVFGEVLRDGGYLSPAIEAYRSAITTYLGGGLSCRAAYMRIVLAETLLAAGRDAEAASELLAALPVIERESLGREGVAAIALLRASLRRAGTDRDALRRLREELDRPRRAGGL